MGAFQLQINMRSISGAKKGHGVDSAFNDLVHLLERGGEIEVLKDSDAIADIVHAHTVDFGSLRLIRRFHKQGKRAVITCHMMEDSLQGSLRLPRFAIKAFGIYLYYFYRRGDRLVVVNPYYREELIRKGLDAEKVFFIPNYADESLFFEVGAEKKAALRQALNLPSDLPVIVSSGQIQRRKGFDDFIACARLNPDYLFVWVGGFSFGRLSDGYDTYRAIVENPPENLRFPGIVAREEVAKYLQASDLFFLASFQELFPMSLLEAAKCGLPVLLRDIPLYPGILFDHYFRATDVNGFSDWIRRICQEEDVRQKGIADARQLASIYSEKSIYRQWKALYEELLKADPSR